MGPECLGCGFYDEDYGCLAFPWDPLPCEEEGEEL